MRVLLLALTSLTLLTGGCLPFGCGPDSQCDSTRTVGLGARCGAGSCQVCGGQLACLYDEDSRAQTCQIDEPIAPIDLAKPADLSQLPDLSQTPDFSPAPDLGQTDAALPDAGPDLE